MEGEEEIRKVSERGRDRKLRVEEERDEIEEEDSLFISEEKR